MNRNQINSTVQSWMSKQHMKQVINGQLVVEDGKVSLQQENGSLIVLSKNDRIEVRNGDRFEPAPYSRIIEKVDTQGWPIYAGLYASVEQNGRESSLMRERTRTELVLVARQICELLAHRGIQPGEVGEVFEHAIDIIRAQVLVVPKEKAPAVTEAESYTKYLPCGTKTKLNLSIEISELDSNDLQEVLSFISTSARHFYLSVGNKLSNMP
ncbi:hypothetical protein PAALTS15_10010 [Paenibacillus alvei TS-15]|uniref:Uncharacterized protein n=1 Tax=Paenibacillus alvei TS-15 TaxID=1117108 RepID=S9TZ09_PAEAL|nr:hypothetical protein [Paenibacillus alvei]EPY07451.1 hypothetical protein PAALTS15_10010 [Paenibacillus alvei TS-15]